MISLVILLAVVLIFVGIEKIISGIFIQHKSRWATVGLGVIVIILASIALAFPVGATVFLIYPYGVRIDVRRLRKDYSRIHRQTA